MKPDAAQVPRMLITASHTSCYLSILHDGLLVLVQLDFVPHVHPQAVLLGAVRITNRGGGKGNKKYGMR